jgi:sulfite reductase alpha subunit-like flavoprotein
MNTQTVFQSLAQNIDIFGKPPERSYEALAKFVSDENEKKRLLILVDQRESMNSSAARLSRYHSIRWHSPRIPIRPTQLPRYRENCPNIGTVDLI